ncbi:MAG: EscU/YscU/HrcU family type III secretion system export apparatus switch protein [Vallitaleaceae bacterium]|nr:EscU/YscU/HrcU family type III secretion system export apparatus switch protein [Vallitaleaceae bacterium]
MEKARKDNKELQKAAAIKYAKDDNAPKVIAKGKGIVAENILKKAEEVDVPIYRDAALVDTLTKLEIGDYIPPELYQVVAEIMIFVSDLDHLRDRL